MVERLATPIGDDARARRRGVAPTAAESPRVEDAARVAPAPAPAPAPAARRAATEAMWTPEVLPPVPAAAQVAALDTQDRYIDAAARQMRIDKGDAMGWWKRKFYVVGNALFGSAVGMSAGSLAAKALAGSALAGALPAWVLGAAVGIPAVLLARYVLGLNKVDRMAKAGRISHKGEKESRKAQRAAEKAGGSYTISDAALQEKMQKLSKRPAWGAIGWGIATGAIFGAVSYELHSPGAQLFTDKMANAATGTWEKSGSLWQQWSDWLWNTACDGTNPGPPETIVPDASSAPVQYSHLGAGKDAQKAVEALSKPPSLDYIMDIKPLVPPPPETLAATHIDASQTLMDKLPTDLANTPSPDTIPLVTDVESVGAEEVETVPEPTFVHSGVEAGHPEFYGFESGMSAQTGWDGFERLTELVGEKPDDFTTDIFDDYMEDSASKAVWADFFGKEIPAGATFQELARTLPNGAELDYNVLTKEYNGITPLEHMIERAEELGNETAVEKLKAIQDTLTRNPDADLKLHIRG